MLSQLAGAGSGRGATLDSKAHPRRQMSGETGGHVCKQDQRTCMLSSRRAGFRPGARSHAASARAATAAADSLMPAGANRRRTGMRHHSGLP
eukprot:6189434-Pleurochrysis_carterae.AAC.5